MKHTLSSGECITLLLRDEYASWSVEAARKLVEYYEEQEQEMGEDIEMDVVAIRCDWSECDSAKEVAECYNALDGLEGKSNDEVEQAVEEYLSENTVFFKLKNGHYLFRQF